MTRWECFWRWESSAACSHNDIAFVLAMPAALLFEPVHGILAVFLRGALEHYRASICPDDQSRLHARLPAAHPAGCASSCRLRSSPTSREGYLGPSPWRHLGCPRGGRPGSFGWLACRLLWRLLRVLSFLLELQRRHGADRALRADKLVVDGVDRPARD